MRCHICNADMNEVYVDERDGSFRPCYECEAVVQESLEYWEQQEDDDTYILDEDFDEDFNTEYVNDR